MLEAQSQVLYPYNFSSNTTAYQPLVGATTLFQGEKWDDTVAYIPIGFSFKWAYDNYSTDSIWIDTYGILHAKVDSIFIWGFPGSTISGYWADLCDLAYNNPDSTVPAQSSISYQTTGNAGSRIFKVEYKNCGFYNDTSALDAVNFQIWLYEGSNVIEYHYGKQDIQDIELDFDATGPHIGLEYKSTLTISGNMITAYSVDSNSVVSGTNTSFSNAFNSTPINFFTGLPNSYFMQAVPDSGQVFRYTPLFQTGLAHTDLFRNTIVYPTKFDQTIYIKSDLKKYVGELLDLNGNRITRFEGNENSSINIPNLTSGNYLLRLTSDQSTELFRLVKP